MRRSLIVFVTILAFSIAHASFAGESFGLVSSPENYEPYKAKLPSGSSTLTFEATLGMPVSENTVPNLHIRFPRNKKENLVDIVISDEICTGEYNTAATFLPSKSVIENAYFDSKIPWPETIEIEIKANRKADNGFSHMIKINEEVETILTESKLKKFEIDVNGTVEIENLEIKKEK